MTQNAKRLFKNIILIISGTMASGKDAVLETLRKNTDFYLIKSLTSRPKRINEKINPPYEFISRNKFKKLLIERKFLESKKLYGHFYGITKKEIEKAFTSQKPVIFRVDEQGAVEIKKVWPEAKSIFIAPPSLKIIKERVAKRKNTSLHLINSRLAAAKKQLASLKDAKWDYVIINKNLEDSAKKISKILNSLNSLKNNKGAVDRD